MQDVIQSALAGRELSYVWEGERRFAVTVRLSEQERDLARIKEISIATPGGAFVPLQEIATFRSTSGAMNIAREGGRRVLSIGVFIKDRDMGSVVKDMQAAVAKSVQLKQGYQIGWSGEFENQERAMARLAWVVPLSILIIFMLLYNAFGSLKNATLIIANIPFAMIGGILALYFTDIALSVSAAIGFIALFGQNPTAPGDRDYRRSDHRHLADAAGAAHAVLVGTRRRAARAGLSARGYQRRSRNYFLTLSEPGRLP